MSKCAGIFRGDGWKIKDKVEKCRFLEFFVGDTTFHRSYILDIKFNSFFSFRLAGALKLTVPFEIVSTKLP